MAKLTENQLLYMSELGISKQQAAEILQKEQIAKLADLTRSQAFQVIAASIDKLARTFHPGVILHIKIHVTEAEDEGLPVSFHGEAQMKSYEIQMGEHGLYLNAVLRIPSLNRTIKRSLPYLLKNAKVKKESAQGKDMAEMEIEKYHRLQHSCCWLVKNISKIWTDMIHEEQLQKRALKNDRLSPQLKAKLIKEILGYMEAYSPNLLMEINEINVREIIREVAGKVLFK